MSSQEEYLLPVDDGTGGHATLTCSILGTSDPLELHFDIKGKNPMNDVTCKKAQDYKDDPMALGALWMEESELVQFAYRKAWGKIGFPFCNPDGGYGLGQLTEPPATWPQMWNWIENADESIKRFEAFYKKAKDHLDKLRKYHKDVDIRVLDYYMDAWSYYNTFSVTYWSDTEVVIEQGKERPKVGKDFRGKAHAQHCKDYYEHPKNWWVEQK